MLSRRSQGTYQRRVETYNIIRHQKTVLLTPVAWELPEQTGSNQRWAHVGDHDPGSDIGEARGQPRAAEDKRGQPGTVRDAVHGRQEGVAAGESLDDELAEVGQSAVDALVQQHEEEKEPDLRVRQSFFDLRRFDRARLLAILVAVASRNQQGLLLDRVKPGADDGVGQEEEQNHTPADGDAAAEDENNAPDVPSFGLTDAVEQQAADDAAEAVETVEQTRPDGLFGSSVPGADQQHETRRDGGLEGA